MYLLALSSLQAMCKQMVHTHINRQTAHIELHITMVFHVLVDLLSTSPSIMSIIESCQNRTEIYVYMDNILIITNPPLLVDIVCWCDVAMNCYVYRKLAFLILNRIIHTVIELHNSLINVLGLHQQLRHDIWLHILRI